MYSYIFPGFINQIDESDNFWGREYEYPLALRLGVIVENELFDLDVFEPAILDFSAWNSIVD